ncbi:MAG: DUF481 domain-containing protein [Proteobacteria bacterium]|nr:DUF481 domain-containing protein [Pseudomonadota bacterium]
MIGKMMIRKTFLFIGACLTVLLLCTFGAAADEVRLANGDRLTGDIISIENQVLLLKTGYAGDIRINWSEVVCIVSPKALDIVLKSGEIVKGQAACPASGQIQIKSPIDQKTVHLLLSDLKALNPPPKKILAYKGNIVAGGSRSDGNTDSQALNTSAQLVIRSKRQRLTLTGAYNYGETDETLTARNAAGSIKYDFFTTQKLYTYAQSLFERDDLQDLRLRTTFGLGMGYQFIDAERTSLSVEAGPSYYQEDFIAAEDQSYSSGRWSIKFNHEIVPKRLNFFHMHEGYYSFEESNSYYVRSEQGLRIPVAKNFFANFQVNFNYNSQPAPGKRKDDIIYIFGLAYDFEL